MPCDARLAFIEQRFEQQGRLDLEPALIAELLDRAAVLAPLEAMRPRVETWLARDNPPWPNNGASGARIFAAQGLLHEMLLALNARRRRAIEAERREQPE